jgi:hypothetical protein
MRAAGQRQRTGTYRYLGTRYGFCWYGTVQYQAYRYGDCDFLLRNHEKATPRRKDPMTTVLSIYLSIYRNEEDDVFSITCSAMPGSITVSSKWQAVFSDCNATALLHSGRSAGRDLVASPL